MSGMDAPSARHRVTAEPDWYDAAAISAGIRVGDLVFLSGQVAVDEQLNTVGGDDFEAQARRAFANLSTVLTNAGSGLEHVVKVSIYVTDMTAVLPTIVALRREFFTEPYPADTLLQVASLADPGWLIEIDCVAVVPDPG